MVPLFLFTFLKESLACVVQPLLFAQVIRFFADPQSHNYLHACLYAAGVVGSNCLHTAMHHPVMLLTTTMGIQARVAWVTLIYRKVGLPLCPLLAQFDWLQSLRLNMTAFSQTTVGQILNMMSNDVSKIEWVTILPK